MDTRIRVDSKYYWLIFNKGSSSLQNRICKNFGHLTILSRDEYNWYIIDPQPGNLSVEILAYKISDNVPLKLKRKKQTLKIIKLEVNQSEIKSKKFNILSIFIPRCVNCVSIIKYILGIKIKGFNPYGIYKNLKKMSKYPNQKLKNQNILYIEEI